MIILKNPQFKEPSVQFASGKTTEPDLIQIILLAGFCVEPGYTNPVSVIIIKNYEEFICDFVTRPEQLT